MLLGLAGCAFLFKAQVDDLGLAQMRLATFSEAQEDMLSHAPTAEKNTVVVLLRTSHDLDAMAKAHGWYSVDAQVHDCKNGDKLWTSPLYEGHHIVPELDISRPADQVRAPLPDLSGSPRTFRFPLRDRFSGVGRGSDFVTYDLRKQPRDLCITLWAAPYMAIGVGLTSNSVVIPKSAIIDVFHTE